MPAVTVAIPTQNRAEFLRRAVASVQEQSFRNFEIVVVDNASTDGTSEVIDGMADSSIRHDRSESTLGMLDNWNRCIQLAKGELLVILGDDDVMDRRFLEMSVCPHRENPGLAFTYAHCEKVDPEGVFLSRWGYQFAPAGVMTGAEYIIWSARFGCCLTNSSTVLMRTDLARSAGGFRAPFASNTFDFNMWLRLAQNHAVCFLDESLAQYTIHDNQVSALHWRSSNQTGRIGTELELIGALSELLKTRSPEVDVHELAELAGRANLRLAKLLSTVVPNL